MTPLRPADDPRDLEISSGDAALFVNVVGGGMRRLHVGPWEVLDSYEEGTVPVGRRGGVLFPWPNRTADGQYTFEGQARQLDLSDAKGHTAIHGLLSWQRWQVLAHEPSKLTLGTVVEQRPGFPFRLAISLTYAITPADLHVTVDVANLGTTDAPFGVGMHPYFSVGCPVDEATLTLHARKRELQDPRGIPTGVREDFDGAIGLVGDRVLDAALTDLTAGPHLTLSGPRGELRLTVDEHWRWLQVFTGDTLPPGQRRLSLAVEPMTCPPNALQSGEDLLVVAPGGTWQGTFTLAWSPA